MIRGRLGYALALVAGGLFYLFFRGWLSFFVLVVVLLLPILSLLLFLPAARRCRMELSARPGAVNKGEEVVFTAKFTNTGLLPILWAGCRFRVENGLGDGERPRRCTLSLGPKSHALAEYPVSSLYAGAILCRAEGAKCVDPLGLFSRSLGKQSAVRAYVLPQVLPITPAVTATAAAAAGDRTQPEHPGDDPSETRDVRPYRPGDPMRAVHWKLSTRTEDLMVREFSQSADCAVELLLDLNGSLEGRDLVLDAVASLHACLEDCGVGHRVSWFDPSSGTLLSQDLHREEEWPPVLRALLAPPGAAGAALACRAALGGRPARLVCLTARLDDGTQALLARLEPDLTLTPGGEAPLPKGVIPLARDTLTQTLSGLSL